MHLLPLLEKAIRIAVLKHAGQFDKAGVPYILHPLRVMNACETVEEKIVGISHDLLEDCFKTIEEGIAYLEHEGFPGYIIDAIVSVTHKPHESWEDFIMRCKDNEIGRKVKKRDMRDNSDLHRMKDVEEKHLRMIRKYHWGMKQLRKSGKIYITS